MTRFREVQRHRWVWLFPIAVLVVGSALGAQLTDAPFLLIPLSISFALWLLCPIETEVNDDIITVRSRCNFTTREYSVYQLRRFEIVTVHPFRDFIRTGVDRGVFGISFYAHGTRAVQLELTSGESLLVGSQRCEELVEALRAAFGR